MKLSKLLELLQHYQEDYPFDDFEVVMITETEKTGQVEQPVDGLALSDRRRTIFLLPKDF